MIPDSLIEGQEKDKEYSATHLQDLKNQILEERANKNKGNTSMDNASPHRVRHPKYGTGSVVKEDDMMITIYFDDYGEKELMKMFGGIEEIS